METKKWYQSKTVWVNVFIGLVAAVDGATGALRDVINPHTVDFLFGITAVANVALRSQNKPILN